MSVEVKWLRQDATINTTATDLNPCIACDATGNTYISYASSGTASGGTTLGVQDIIVFKLDSSGNRVWLKQDATINTIAANLNPCIACDAAGNAYISYASNGTASGGTAVGDQDIIVFKLDSNGNRLWLKQDNTLSTSDYDNLPKIACNLVNCFVTYTTEGTASGGTYIGGNKDIVVCKLDDSGNTVWIKQTGTPYTDGNPNYEDANPSIACNNSGNCYVAYTSKGTASGGSNIGNVDIIVFKLDASGNCVWVKQNATINTTGYDESPSIACDNSGNCYVAYTSDGTASGGTYIGNRDIIVFKLDDSGNCVWVKQNATNNTTVDDLSPSIACDNGGNCYVAYHSDGTSSGGTPTGSRDIIVFKLDANGNSVWLKQDSTTNTTGNDSVPNIACDSINNVYVSYMSFGTGSGGTYVGGLTDIIIFKLGPPPEPVPCFLGDARVLTPCGYVAINRLKPGNPIVTADGRIVPIKRCVVTVSKSSAPYIIPAGQFGCRWPLGISGAHRIFPDSYVFRDCWNPIRDMKAVRDIAGLPRMPVRGNIRWYNLQLPDYYKDTLIVNGVIAESLRH